MATSVFTAALTLYLVRALGPAGYGTFALAIGLSAILLLPADFGISASTGRFVAERLDSDAEIHGVVVMALRLKIAFAAVTALALFLLAGPLSDAYGSPELAWPLRGVALAMFGQSLMQLSQALFVAIGKLSRNFTLVATESAIEFSASLTLVLLGAGASGAAFGRAVGYVFGAALGLLLISRFVKGSIWRSAAASPVVRREFVVYAGALLIIDGAYALFSQVDVLIISALLGTTATGFYSAPIRLIAFLGYPGLAVAQAVTPRLAKRGRPMRSDVVRLEAGLRLMILLQVALATFTLVWAKPIVDLLLGAGYQESVPLFRAFAPIIFMLGLGPLVSLALNYTGHARRRVAITLVAVAVNAVLDLALIPSMGIVGAAIGTGVAYAIYVGWHLHVCREALGLAVSPLAVSLLRAGAAAIPLAALLLALQAGGLSAPEWVIGLLLGPALMMATLVLIREVRPQELAGLSAVARSLVARR
jgi:O-antigen/teichoic acid export membrane protein